MTYTVDSIAIRHAMLNKGYLTLTSLAKASGISRYYISNILSGKSNPSSEVIRKLANTLDLTEHDIGDIFFKKELA